jgi:TrmH family RNA methyltransferase
VLETVEKPGNLGAILRTADAAKVDAVIICDNQTDIYNPNIIRSSLGSIFTNQVVCCRNDEAFEFLKNNNIRSYATSLKAGKLYYDCDYNKASALLMGSEAKGLSPFWHEKADELIKIPMDGKVDSLNVSVSTAVVVFEAFRQRRSSTH